MRKMRKISSLAALLLAVAVLTAIAPAAEKAAYHRKIDRFFELIKKGKPVEALNFIYSENPWVSKRSDAVQRLKDQMVSLNNLVGEFRNHDLLQEKVISDRFAYISYLVSYDRQPIRFIFEFYRPQEKWVLFSFSYDDTLDDDLEAEAKKTLLAD